MLRTALILFGIISTAFAAGTDPDSDVIARVTGIRHPLLDPTITQRARIGLSEQMGQDVALTLANAAKTRQGVTIHPEVVDRVVGGESS